MTASQVSWTDFLRRGARFDECHRDPHERPVLASHQPSERRFVAGTEPGDEQRFVALGSLRPLRCKHGARMTRALGRGQGKRRSESAVTNRAVPSLRRKGASHATSRLQSGLPGLRGDGHRPVAEHALSLGLQRRRPRQDEDDPERGGREGWRDDCRGRAPGGRPRPARPPKRDREHRAVRCARSRLCARRRFRARCGGALRGVYGGAPRPFLGVPRRQAALAIDVFRSWRAGHGHSDRDDRQGARRRGLNLRLRRDAALLQRPAGGGEQVRLDERVEIPSRTPSTFPVSYDVRRSFTRRYGAST